MHRFDAYSSTSYSRGIRWLPSPEVCRMVRGLDWFSRYGIRLRMHREPVRNFTSCTIRSSRISTNFVVNTCQKKGKTYKTRLMLLYTIPLIPKPFTVLFHYLILPTTKMQSIVSSVLAVPTTMLSKTAG